MKKSSILILMFFLKQNAFACRACGKQQPKVLEGITHGAGPDSNWDYLIVGIMVIVTLYVLYATIKCLIKPAENSGNHIKRMVLNDFDQ